MQMADDPNMNFGAFSQSLCNQQVVSFQISTISGGSGGMPVYLDCSTGIDANAGMMSTTTPSVVVSTGSSNMPADSGQNLKSGGPLAAVWSYFELQVLKEGLERYVNEQGIMKYIKIAASLPHKTVRDVAMRCQWAAGKKVSTRRRKHDEHHMGRKIKERKDELVEPTMRTVNHPVQTDIRVSSFTPPNVQNNASEIDRAVQLRLEENNQLLKQIETNIGTFQAHNNIGLFLRIRGNINNLLHSMSQMPGIMSKMPPLRVALNENLASFVLPGLAMEQVLGSNHLKEEPIGWPLPPGFSLWRERSKLQAGARAGEKSWPSIVAGAHAPERAERVSSGTYLRCPSGFRRFLQGISCCYMSICILLFAGVFLLTLGGRDLRGEEGGQGTRAGLRFRAKLVA